MLARHEIQHYPEPLAGHQLCRLHHGALAGIKGEA